MHMQTEVLKHVSANVRRFRSMAQLSQVALADRAGISRRTLVKLEAGEANISLAALDRLADALGVTFVDVVAAPAAPPTNIREVAWRGEGAGSIAMLLASVPATREVQLWSWTLEPGDRYDADADPEGWSEILSVSEGCIRVEQEAGHTELRTGDHLAFPSSQHYAYVNIGDALARFVRILVS